MYGYEYETYILLFLRLMKFLWTYFPEAYKTIVSSSSLVDKDGMYDIVDELLWVFFDDVTPDGGEDGEEPYTVVRFYNDEIDRLYEQGIKSNHLFPCKVGAWQEKIKDMFCHFVVETTNSVWDARIRFCGGSVTFDITLSTDCYEPIGFFNSIIDMLLYCHRELLRMERIEVEETEETVAHIEEVA